MYCHKCGKQVPDNAAFCSECGAKLQSGTTSDGQNNDMDSRVIEMASIASGIICIIISLIVLLWALSTYSNDTSRYPFGGYNYESPLTGHEVFVIVMGIFGFSGVVGGIIDLCRSRLKNSKQPNLAGQGKPQATPPTARKLTIQGHESVIKCSRCGREQTSNRTTCQSCGAKFVE